MSKPIERIESLMTSLPEKDVPLGFKFLKERNFDSLKELIDSAIYKINKNLNSTSPREEYLKIDRENLSTLKSEVDTYMIQIGVPEEPIYEEDFDECNINEEDFY